MALTTNPMRSAVNWTTQYAAAIEQVYRQVQDVHKQAAPTMNLLIDEQDQVELGPDGKIGQNFIHQMYDVYAASHNQVFAAPNIEAFSRMEYTTEQMYISAGSNDVEWQRYNSDHSRINLINEKVQAMHAGLTWVFNYLLFSDWSETGPGTTDEIDLSSELSNSPIPPSVKFKNLTAHGNRINSIPMIIRKHVTGHTLGNVSSANSFWAPTVTDATGATVSRNTTSTDEQCDVVTDDDAANPQTLDLMDIKAHLSAVQRGAGYELYAACPADLYGVLEDLVLSIDRRDHSKESRMVDLGVDATFKYAAYGTTFYVEPMMTDLWPGSIFFFDPSVMKLVFDSRFNPSKGTGVYLWERIPGSNRYATALWVDCQLCCWDRRGVSAMHGYKK